MRVWPGHQARVAYVNMGSIHAWTARRIILASTPRTVLASIISPADALRPLLAIMSAWLLKDKRESKYTPTISWTYFLSRA